MASTASPSSVSDAVRKAPRSGYLPGLDGWRALAILAVLMAHDDPWALFGHSNASFHAYGGWGVYLFFAISGFLVTTRILEDESLLGRFRVGSFYIRRIFRIQPAALAYLIAVALLTVVGITHERHSALLGGLFLYQNYLYSQNDHTGTWALTGHFWTLAVEEHFYILLSVLLLFFRRRRAWLFTGLIVLLLLWQRLSIHLRVYAGVSAERRTEWNLQFLLLPALFAILLRRKQILDLYVKYLHPWVAIVGTVAAKEIALLLHPLPAQFTHGALFWFLDEPWILFFGFGFWVVATVLHPRSWTTRTLELKPLRFVGRLSYSIYLWHVLFFVSSIPSTGVHNQVLLFVASRPWRYVATALVAMLSYYLIEKPLIRLGHRLAPPATPGHADLRDPAEQRPEAILQSA